MAQLRERQKPLSVILSLPKAFGQARELFFSKHQVAPQVAVAEEDVSAFAPPKGVDLTTADGQRAMKLYRAVRARRLRGSGVAPENHIAPGRLTVLLGTGAGSLTTTRETSAKPPFLKDFTRSRVKARDSMDRNVRRGRELIHETAELDHMFRHTNHNVSREDAVKALAEQHERRIAALQDTGSSVVWEQGEAVPQVKVEWE